jgi:RNA polymerase sigma factor (sigma-70 family)
VIVESDESLLAAGRRGDDGALARLVERHRAGLAAFVTRRLGAQKAWAEDVVQDVILTLYRTTRRYEGRSAFRTWLLGIARNVCRERLRRERHAPADDRAFAAVPDASLDPLQRMMRAERQALVRSAVAGLSDTHRLVLRLRDRDGLSYAEIAEVLDVPIGTVRSRVHNARAALGRALAATIAGGGR